MSNAWQEKTITGLNIRVREGNPDKCLVLLHGVGSNAFSFDRVAGYLPSDITLVAWNAPGYGGSRALTMDVPVPADYADALVQMVDALGLKDFTLVGHSMGTMMATEFAARYPHYLKSLVLLACAQGYGARAGDPLPAKAADRLKALSDAGPREFAKARASGLIFQPELNPGLTEAAIAAMAAIEVSGYAQAVHMLAWGDQVSRARDVQIASLVVVGAQDQITPPGQSIAIHGALKLASPQMVHRYHEIDKSGHLVHQEQPAKTAGYIAEFAGWTA